MARGVQPPRDAGEVGSLLDLPPTEETAVVPSVHFEQPKGLDLRTPVYRLDPAFCRALKNMRVRDGSLQARPGTSVVGTTLMTPEMTGLLKFVRGSDVGNIVRFGTTRIDAFDGTDWFIVTGPGGGNYTPAGSDEDLFSFAAFGDTVMFSQGVDPIHELDFNSFVVNAVTGAPVAKHVTTFTGRIIASNVSDPDKHPERIRWTVKNNSLDWTGTGSGFEDVRSTPGGSTDSQQAVVPVTDTRALVIRSNSIWVMISTGLIDAPFRFDQIAPNFGTRARNSIAPVPGGCVGWFRDNVYFVGLSNQQPIGDKIKRTFKALITDEKLVIGAYNPLDREYLLGIVASTTVYRYSFDDKAWSVTELPNGVNYMAYELASVTPRTIDSLLGTIDNLTGTIDGLVNTTFSTEGMLLAQTGSNAHVVREDDAVTRDETDVGVFSEAEIIAQTGVVRTPVDNSTRRPIEVIRVKTEYVADDVQTMLIEYTYDNGATWTSYGQFDTVDTNGDSLVETLTEHLAARRSYQFRLRSVKMENLKILSFVAAVKATIEEGR